MNTIEKPKPGILRPFLANPGLVRPIHVPIHAAALGGRPRLNAPGMRQDLGLGNIIQDAKKVIQKFGRLEGHFWGRFEIDIKDKNGRIVDHREGPSRSFLRNFGLMFLQMIYTPGDNNINFTDASGNARKFAVMDTGVDGNTTDMGPIAGVADIACGDSNTAVDSSQFNLQGAVMNVPVVVATVLNVENAAHRNWQHSATILNNTGLTVNVVEAALFAHLTQGDLNGQNRRVMMMRDVFTAVPILDGSSAVVTYVFDVAV